MKPIVQQLTFARATKNTYRYEAEHAPGDHSPSEPLDTIYIHKDAFDEKTPPARITVTIAEAA